MIKTKRILNLIKLKSKIFLSKVVKILFNTINLFKTTSDTPPVISAGSIGFSSGTSHSFMVTSDASVYSAVPGFTPFILREQHGIMYGNIMISTLYQQAKYII